MGVAGVSAWYLLRPGTGNAEGLLAGDVDGGGRGAGAGGDRRPARAEHDPSPADEGGGDGGGWETTRGMHMLLFAIPDQAAATNRYEIGIPGSAA